MNYEDYYNYKEAIKRLDTNNHHLYINNLISILELSDNDLLKIVYKEVLNDNFECLKTSIRNKEVIFTPSLVIDMLNEIQRNSRLVVGRYVSSITKDKSKDEIIDIYDDIKNCNIVYIEIIKNIYTEKYGYLKDGIFNEVYLNCLNDLENIFMTYFRNLIGSWKKDIVRYNIFPCNVEVRHGHDGYGYYKKYKR